MIEFLSRTNKWKFLSFALIGILATGFLVPSALGQARPGPPEVWEAIDDLQQQITDIELLPGPQGEPGADGQDGADGTNGQDGLNCWDLNDDGVKDDSEDINNDGVHDAQDCQGPQGEPGADGADGQDADTAALQAEIDTLEVEVADLTARIEALENGDGGGDGGTTDNDGDGFTTSEGDCNDDNPAINPDETETVNSLDDDCDGVVDNVPDEYEPNNHGGEPADLGSISDGSTPVQINANMHSTTDEDHYVFTAIHSDADGEVVTGITATLTNIPEGSNYDLFIQCDRCVETGDDDDVFSSTQTGNSDETVFVDQDTSFDDNNAVVTIEVRNVSDTASGDEYTLTITVT